MVKSRRPRGGSSDVRGTLGSLVRTTLAQAGVVRDVLERGAREGRARLEEVRRDRARDGALMELGQAVLELLEDGQFPELLEVPAISDALAAIETSEPEVPAPPASTRRAPAFDRDARPRGPLFDGAAPRRPAPRDRDDDGTVSSAGWRPPPARAAAVWRPPVEAAAAPPPPARPGGIRFDRADEDDDLAEYMHPDDVPSREPNT